VKFEVSVPDPYQFELLDPESGPGTRRAKMTHKNRKMKRKFMF
jgi:hypothetical protein